MKIKNFLSFTESDLSNTEIDICIAASGYESRSRSFAEKIDKLKVKVAHKYVWAFTENSTEKMRLKNDEKFKKLGFKPTIISGSDSQKPNKIIKKMLSEIKTNNQVTLLIDISSMTRTWYGAIIEALAQVESPIPLRTIFAYVPAVWKPVNKEYPSNEILGPVSGYSSHELPNKPTALIIGLGQEEGRALGLREHLDPEALVCFYANPSIDKRYEELVFEENKDLLDNLNSDYIYAYNIFDTFGTYKTLESVCNGLIRDYSIVLASLGPKIFGIYCFLLATMQPTISVWRVSPATKQEPIDHKPVKQYISFIVDWK